MNHVRARRVLRGPWTLWLVRLVTRLTLLAVAAAVAVVVGAAGCRGSGTDAAPADAAGTDAWMPPVIPPWDPGLVPTSELTVSRGLRPARGIIHLHTVYSHDACDGMPELSPGVSNEPCNESLRAGLCTTHQDYALYTDHDGLLADTAFDDALVIRAGDEPIADPISGANVANRIVCPDGHRVLAMVGGENELMPVGLDEHPPGYALGAPLSALYNAVDAAMIAEFESVGGMVLIAHTESHMTEAMTLPIAGLELYNLHANLAPDIRADYLGLEPLGAILAIADFGAQGNLGDPEPDLMFLAFHEENLPALATWDAVLAVRPIVATMGSDAHENAVPLLQPDGERGDSYRRVMKWFSNHLLVPDVDRDAVRDALRGGRAYGAIEILGTPDGFDFHGETAGAGGPLVHEMGATVSLADLPALVAIAPAVHGLAAGTTPPPVTIELLHVTAGGTASVATSAAGDPMLTFAPTAPGAYRVVVRITPTHLEPWLGNDAATWIVEYPWLYANAIYVEP